MSDTSDTVLPTLDVLYSHLNAMYDTMQGDSIDGAALLAACRAAVDDVTPAAPDAAWQAHRLRRRITAAYEVAGFALYDAAYWLPGLLWVGEVLATGQAPEGGADGREG